MADVPREAAGCPRHPNKQVQSSSSQREAGVQNEEADAPLSLSPSGHVLQHEAGEYLACRPRLRVCLPRAGIVNESRPLTLDAASDSPSAQPLQQPELSEWSWPAG